MDEEALVRVVRGRPSAADLAALVAVLAGLSGATDSGTSQEPTPNWVFRARPTTVPRSWRDSGLPR